MKTYHTFFVLLCIQSGLLYGAKTQALGQVFLNLDVGKVESGFKIQGTAEFEISTNAPSVCFLIPSQKTQRVNHYYPLSHLDDFLKRLPTQAKSSNIKIKIDGITTDMQDAEKRMISSSIMEVITHGHKRVSIKFQSNVTEYGDIQLFDNFYPRQLESCPSASSLKAKERTRSVIQAIHVKITNSSLWNLLAPGGAYSTDKTHAEKSIYEPILYEEKSLSRLRIFPHDQNVKISADRYTFALARNNSLNHYQIKVGNKKIFLALQSPLGQALFKTILGAFKSHSRWFGPFPFQDLTIVETSSIIRQELPGLIALNRPNQYVFQKLQESFLNWQHWVVTNLIASQWYGSAIKTAEKNEEWLLKGTCDFASLAFLQGDQHRFNLFNNFDQDFDLLSLDYLQVQDMTASLLFKNNPLITLTNSDIISTDPSGKYTGLNYVKHSIAMRYLRFSMGQDALSNKLNSFSQNSINGLIEPRDLHKSLSPDASSYLKEWWTKPGWPNYSVLSLDKKKLASGKWVAEARIMNSQEFNIPVQVRFIDKSGKYYLLNDKPISGGKTERVITTTTEDEPVNVRIDPYHHLFDSDRFNNQASIPDFNFFPLGSNTIADDAYTSVWIPYFFRRPGEQTSVAVQAALFRYLQSGIVANISFSPADSRLFYLLRYRMAFPYQHANVEISTNRTYDALRTEKLSLSKNLTKSNSLSANIIFRHRQTMGQPQSPHPTISAGIVYDQDALENKLRVAAQLDVEHALAMRKSSIAYTRPTARLELTLSPRPQWAYIARFFSGKLMDLGGYLPETAKFKINELDELGIRLDSRNLEQTLQAYSFKQDLLVPLTLSLWKRSMILGKQLQVRFFHDFGGSQIDRSIDYAATGVGIILPLGGDVLGVGPLALSRFSILVVLNSRRNTNVSKRPKILFDLTGSL